VGSSNQSQAEDGYRETYDSDYRRPTTRPQGQRPQSRASAQLPEIIFAKGT